MICGCVLSTFKMIENGHKSEQVINTFLCSSVATSLVCSARAACQAGRRVCGNRPDAILAQAAHIAI